CRWTVVIKAVLRPAPQLARPGLPIETSPRVRRFLERTLTRRAGLWPAASAEACQHCCAPTAVRDRPAPPRLGLNGLSIKPVRRFPALIRFLGQCWPLFAT